MLSMPPIGGVLTVVPIEQQSRAASAPTTKRRSDHQTVPALVARPGGAAERFAGALGDRHPALVFALALLGGFLVLAPAAAPAGVVVVPGGQTRALQLDQGCRHLSRAPAADGQASAGPSQPGQTGRIPAAGRRRAGSIVAAGA